MSEQTIDLKKRRFLTNATSVVGAVGVGFVAWPFLSTWNPSARAKAAGAPVEVDISKLGEGQLVRVLWRKQPVWIFKRDKTTVSNLSTLNDILVDPNSLETSQQPEYAKNPYRSINPDIAVIIGSCTHLGCSPTYRPELGAADLGGDAWKGGFYCPCHGSKFDLAGRVYIDVPAPINLMIPPYHFVSDTLIQIGVSPEEHEVTPIFKSNKLT
ncbi:ubiquinol-cytochrome c reductase iron-sulfur subunit [bacterium endosymbiont of Bathymodiolus sp. 5 South]|uniref:ubiquinol-cytochrome c reductase iron-sulfur subunit n=1 Tax=bacterium endosymbiont of Bathymodiolus sp. 5 South TaxID=1181670 RepID=UPI0010B3E15F|nr:ubiquinol-cytochrome c reductase iron-sulfur subunit [bacterium endosymbiont of Bathymodiolus sp. 5 South]CAC9635437.1 Ubiquinol-cytochrome C reductase iron-sulfur subunit (EC 1.10.2.2) [uncultured Gammaproteobacteria bacterium]CAC9650417.1 Ubiquinol-cytochrome C reductase iron-sulfur subunit (EC 1.10.2.2) [uncultured Gammaproteobacteria bacterium]CAC9657761.1 Ubiquinol-cytochrome C reductase iron-sulfur subunit (EC 1.10.2.2) [uncultured Gammaproteobacteria bacterium]SHN89971.1 Ubiquinol-cyt